MTYMDAFMDRLLMQWQAEQSSLPITAKNAYVDVALTAPGCPVRGRMFWKPLPFSAEERLSIEAQLAAWAPHESLAEYLASWRRCDPCIEVFGRIFRLLPIADAITPPRMMYEAYAVWERYAARQPFSLALGETTDKGLPLQLMVNVSSGELFLLDAVRMQVRMRYRMGMEAFFQMVTIVTGDVPYAG